VVHVVSDARTNFYQLTTHLIGLGRKSIAYLNGPPLWTNRERRAGYLQAMHEAKLEPQEATLPALYQEGGAALAPDLLLARNRPDAVLAFDDLAAIGFMTMAQNLGFVVPRDVAIAGAGNLPLTDLIRPSLTTVDTNTHELGRSAMCLLLDQIEGKKVATSTIIKGKLVIRESSSPAR
jgi:DNA-binding LacI/PurR family transcriptional regulator